MSKLGISSRMWEESREELIKQDGSCIRLAAQRREDLPSRRQTNSYMHLKGRSNYHKCTSELGI